MTYQVYACTVAYTGQANFLQGTRKTRPCSTTTHHYYLYIKKMYVIFLSKFFLCKILFLVTIRYDMVGLEGELLDRLNPTVRWLICHSDL